MKFRFTSSILTLVLISLLIWTCKTTTKWKGQAPIKAVPTTTLPIQKQNKGIFDLGHGIYASNDFDGARLNGIVLTDDTLITALITPENTPINPSPWYAFKLWSESPKAITLKMTYLDGAFHRYYPKLSRDGLNWTPVEEKNYSTSAIDPASAERPLPKEAQMRLSIGPDTLWIAAQELVTSKHTATWVDQLATKSYISIEKVGQSREGRPIEAMKIGTSDDEKLIFVLSRQHPPEVTGYLAMQ